jgi:hypothetical protein
MAETTMDDPAGTNQPKDGQQAAAYVADLTADLARMARNHGLEALGYLLDMARLEARSIAGPFDKNDVSS